MLFCGLVWIEGPCPTSEHFWPDSCCTLRWTGEALNFSLLVRPHAASSCGFIGETGTPFSSPCTPASLSSSPQAHSVASVWLPLPSWTQRLTVPPGAREGGWEQEAPPQPASLPPGAIAAQCFHHSGSPLWALLSPWAKKGIGGASSVWGKIFLLLWEGNKRYILQYFYKDTILLKRSLHTVFPSSLWFPCLSFGGTRFRPGRF